MPEALGLNPVEHHRTLTTKKEEELHMITAASIKSFISTYSCTLTNHGLTLTFAAGCMCENS